MARSSSAALVAPSARLWLAALALVALGAAGCGRDCCTVDSEPIPASRADAAPSWMAADTPSPVTILEAPATTGALRITQRGFDLLDGSDPAPTPARVRARFRDLGLFTLPLGPVGSPTTLPGGVIGG